MARKKQTRIKEWVWIVVAFIAILIYAIIADWWKGHAIIGWIILGVLVVVLGFLLYRFASLRGWVFRQAKTKIKEAIIETGPPPREPVPVDTRREVLRRAHQICENESCKFQGKPHIHHINMDRDDHRLINLIALCPNCHTRAHAGAFTRTQLGNWVMRDYRRLRRAKS